MKNKPVYETDTITVTSETGKTLAGGYRLITLPRAKTGIAMNGYGFGNTERTTNLLLPGMTDETYICIVNVPSDMQVCTPQKAKEIVNAIYDKKHVWVIDWRWRVITFIWQLIPNIVWRRMNI